MTATIRARLAALECALVAGLRARVTDDPEDARQIAAALQDDMFDGAAAGQNATRAFRAGLREERRQLAARIGAPILPAAPDRIM